MSELKEQNGTSATNPAKEQVIKENLDAYTEGDAEFLIEFGQNILENLLTLKSELPKILARENEDRLSELTHMVKPTIEILGQDEILNRLTNLRSGNQSASDLNSLMILVDETIAILKNILNRTSKFVLAAH